MSRKDADTIAPDEAVDRYVGFDSGATDHTTLAAWLDERPENERALERVELAVEIGRRLAADPSSALHAAAAEAAVPVRRSVAHASAWGVGLAAALLVAIVVIRDGTRPAGSAEPLSMEAARVVAFDAPGNPVAVLPTGGVVDASAVAVLPFTAPDRVLAEGLEREVAAALRTVPGLYVIADAAVSSYAYTDLSPSEIGEQIGARGIVDAAVELVDGRIRVDARLRETTTGAVLWRTSLDRPVDELRAVRTEIAEHVAAAMLDSSLRAPLARVDLSNAAYSAGKPLLQ